jgi:glycosyltransferase involved in cell wall biosynthesis
MKIVLVHNEYQQPGGEDVVFIQEKQILERAGHQVILYQRSNHEITDLSTFDRLLLPARVIWSAKSHREFGSLLAAERPDIVHVHNTFMMISDSIYYACQAHSVPVVRTLHNYRTICPAMGLFRDGAVCEECIDHSLLRSVQHACYRKSHASTAVVAVMLGTHRLLGTGDKLIARNIVLTEFARQKFISAGFSEKKLVVKPNFVDPDPGAGPSTGEYAVFLGRLSMEKGIFTLLNAWGKIKASCPLHVIGNGDEKGKAERAVGMRTTSPILFRGQLPRSEAITTVKNAKFVVMPSLWYEGFPMCIVEAFACGTAVICSRLGGMQEIVRDGVTGLHFSPGDENDLAAKIDWAIGHPSEVSAMGRAARRQFEAEFSAGDNYRRLMQIYHEALGSREREGAVAFTRSD